MSTPRLWFRVDEVLPLAEHAAACFDHKAPPTILPHRPPQGPALIWYGHGPTHQLRSNGLPAWFLRYGAEHVASASAWRDSTITRQVNLSASSFPTGYLPLTEPGQQPDTDVFWIALDPAPRPMLSADAVEFAQQRGDLAPPTARWVPARVAVDRCTGPYPALIPDGCTTDAGEAIPRFERETIERMVADFAAEHDNPDQNTDLMPGELPVLCLHERTTLIISQELDIGADLPITRVTDVLEPDADGLYAVGAHQWGWQQVPPEGEDWPPTEVKRAMHMCVQLRRVLRWVRPRGMRPTRPQAVSRRLLRHDVRCPSTEESRRGAG